MKEKRRGNRETKKPKIEKKSAAPAGAFLPIRSATPTKPAAKSPLKTDSGKG